MTTKIPYEFLHSKVRLTWRDVKFGLDRQLIGPQTAIDRAIDRLSEASDVTPEEVKLAGLSKSDVIIDLVDRLARGEASAAYEANTNAKWLFIVLAWLFENQHSVDDPLAAIEEIYAEFDYPEEIEPFVRYMPMAGPDLGSREPNEGRLYEYWRSYLDIAGKRFSSQ